VADVESQKKIAEFHKLSDAAGMNNAQKHMMLGKHENIDTALEEVRSLAPKTVATPAGVPAEKGTKRGKKGAATPEPQAAPAPASPSQNPLDF
jgi:hypothetical protein